MKDVSTRKLAKHHFLTENSSKYMSIEQMFEHLYSNDLNEKGTQIGWIEGNIEQLSINDK